MNYPVIRYLREPRTGEGKGAPYGVLMATSPGCYGWSLCCKRDTFSRERGKFIAMERAKSGSGIEALRDRAWTVYYGDAPRLHTVLSALCYFADRIEAAE